MFDGAFKQRGDGTSHRERSIESLRAHREGADDDELADVLKVPQRQTVNAICRERAAQGRISREQDDRRPSGTGHAKIVNRWIGG